jgi:hypothetical protein
MINSFLYPDLKKASASLLFILSVILIVCFCQCRFVPDDGDIYIRCDHRSSPFVLPYPVGSTYLCIQGNAPGPNHHPELMKYAVDFAMPMGSPVTAARAGTVVFVEESFADGNFRVGNDNVVVIDHADGTCSRYVHLQKNGALVALNQIVIQGEIIALSGNSGQSLSPHLHFDVTKGDGSKECQTIPVCFKNTQPHPHGLETGIAYMAEPYAQ